MTLAIHGPVQLTPNIRLKEAINKYEATLSDNHKTHFRVLQWDAGKPKPSDVQAFTASIDWKTSHESFSNQFNNTSAVSMSLLGVLNVFQPALCGV